MVSTRRVEEILAYTSESGEEKACEHFGITKDSLKRYLRIGRFYTTKQPKILLLDIETARMIVGAWRLGKQVLGPDQIIRDWFILGWSARWLLDPEKHSTFVTADEALRRDDKRVCEAVWKMIDDADIVITHNGHHFDMPKIKTRFALHRLPPTSPYQSIDTCAIAKKHFGFSSNALNYLSKYLHGKTKLHTDYELWIRCENGDQEAIDYMEQYCNVDIDRLEEAYLELRPYIVSHPNLALLRDDKESCCPNCGSTDLEMTDKYYTTTANQYRMVRCNGCGAYNRMPYGILTHEDRAKLIRPIAR